MFLRMLVKLGGVLLWGVAIRRGARHCAQNVPELHLHCQSDDLQPYRREMRQHLATAANLSTVRME